MSRILWFTVYSIMNTLQIATENSECSFCNVRKHFLNNLLMMLRFWRDTGLHNRVEFNVRFFVVASFFIILPFVCHVYWRVKLIV